MENKKLILDTLWKIWIYKIIEYKRNDELALDNRQGERIGKEWEVYMVLRTSPNKERSMNYLIRINFVKD